MVLNGWIRYCIDQKLKKGAFRLPLRRKQDALRNQRPYDVRPFLYSHPKFFASGFFEQLRSLRLLDLFEILDVPAIDNYGTGFKVATHFQELLTQGIFWVKVNQTAYFPRCFESVVLIDCDKNERLAL